LIIDWAEEKELMESGSWAIDHQINDEKLLTRKLIRMACCLWQISCSLGEMIPVSGSSSVVF
jgi:hypothetical protein